MSHRLAASIVAAVAAVVLAAPSPASAHDRAPVAPFPAAPFSVAVTFPAIPPWVIAALPPPAPAPWVQVSPAVQYGWLDANRAAYLARWGWNPWRVARYEGWYRAYRAGLDARFAPPPRFARVHGHGRGNGWARGHDRDD